MNDPRLGHHTLVIPTYNRPDLLRKLVTHLADWARPMPLLVLDSSADDSAATRNAETVAPHAAYARYQRFPSTTPLAEKLARGLATVDSPTVSFCADDDLVFAPAIARALHFLDAHADHVSAHGLYFNFGEHGHDIQIMGEYAGRSIEAEQPGARLFQLMQSYESLFYGVFRTADLRAIFDNVAELPSLHYQELFQSSAALLIGKVARLPEFYAARRSGPAAEPTRDKWQTYYWFAENPAEFVEHYLAYRSKLWQFYIARVADPALTRADFDRIFDVCHAMYFSKNCPPRYFHSALGQFWREDAFDEREYDMLDELRDGAAPPPRPRAPKRYLPRLKDWIGLRILNAQVRAGGDAWNCHIVGELRWLARNDDFRARYRDLCLYLDATA